MENVNFFILNFFVSLIIFNRNNEYVLCLCHFIDLLGVKRHGAVIKKFSSLLFFSKIYFIHFILFIIFFSSLILFGISTFFEIFNFYASCNNKEFIKISNNFEIIFFFWSFLLPSVKNDILLKMYLC